MILDDKLKLLSTQVHLVSFWSVVGSLRGSPDPSLAIAVDIGGTFTDISLLDRASGRVWRAKTPSVPSDPSEAFLAGIRLALLEAGADASSLGQVLHGTTVATNALLQGQIDNLALIVTKGFRHVTQRECDADTVGQVVRHHGVRGARTGGDQQRHGRQNRCRRTRPHESVSGWRVRSSRIGTPLRPR